MLSSRQTRDKQFAQAVLTSKEYGIFTLSPDGIILSWQIGAEIVQGYTEEEVLGKPFAELYGKEVGKPKEYFEEILDDVKKHGRYEEEGWRQRKDGTYFWSTILITPIYDENKNLIAYSAISRDLTDRKLVSEISEISEVSGSHHGPVLATSNIIWSRAKDGQFLVPHLQWEHFTGQIWPEYEGFGWLKMHPPEEHEKIKAFWAHLQTLDLRELQKDWQVLQSSSLCQALTLATLTWSKIHKEYRHTVMTAVPHFRKEGEVYEWLGNEKDVHKATLMSIQLKEARDIQGLMLNSARIGLWQWNLKNNLIELDENTATYLGIACKSFQSIDEIIAHIHPEDRLQTQATFKQSIEKKEPYNIEFRTLWPDGTTHHVAGRGNVLCDSQNKPTKLLGSYWDITETKQIFEERTHAKLTEKKYEEQKAFVNTVCHELRNPSNGILGSLEEMQGIIDELNKIQATKKSTELLAEEFTARINQLKRSMITIENCVTHQCQVIDHVVDISEIQSNKVKLQEETFSLNKIIEDLIKKYNLTNEKGKIHFLYEAEKKDFWIKSDKNRFLQALDYIFSYASHHKAEDRAVKMTLSISSHQEEYINFEINIEINGLYIPPERRASLLEEYMPVSHHDTEKYSTESFSLAISKGITQILGGKINLESTPQHGSIIHLEFDLKKGQKPKEAVKSSSAFFSPAISSKTKKILIVEDNQTNQTMLKHLLDKNENYQSHIAMNGQEAVDRYLDIRPDWIFMDIEMPLKDGFEATQEIREQEKKEGLSPVPICALTAYSGTEYEARAKQVGMTNYLIKPYRPQEIRELLANHFESQEKQKELSHI